MKQRKVGKTYILKSLKGKALPANKITPLEFFTSFVQTLVKIFMNALYTNTPCWTSYNHTYTTKTVRNFYFTSGTTNWLTNI